MNKSVLLVSLNLFVSSVVSAEALKIAFVKQVVYPDLYCCSQDTPTKDLIFSSLRRSGPVALFTKFSADFYIVHQEPDPECFIWQEKEAHLQQASKEFFNNLATSNTNMGSFVKEGSRKAQGEYAVHCDDINWDNYDIVIAIDAAIPARITQQYPNSLWAYYISEACPTSHRSFDTCLEGYDCFFTHSFFASRTLKEHVIDFPYHLQYYPCFHELTKIAPDDSAQRSHTALEMLTNRYWPDGKKAKIEKITPLAQPKSKELQDFISMLLKSKYFVVCIEPTESAVDIHLQLSTKKILGNSLIEAIAAGALVIATRQSIHNSDILTDATLVDTFEEVLERLAYFEAHPNAYRQEVEKQRVQLNWLCCERPMAQLIEKLHHKRTLQNR